MTASVSAPLCRDCWDEFDIDTSPDVERCAAEQASHDGTTLLIAGQPRFGKGVVLIAPFDLIVSAPARREQREG